MDAAHKSGWQIAEVVLGIPFLIAVAVHFAAPFPLAHGILRLVLIPAGFALVAIGIGVIVSARREFGRYRQPTDPGQPTRILIRTGVFSISRNPLYLGGALVFLGIALILNMVWALLALLVSLALCHVILIVPEERYLAAKFGEAYAEYCATVHRWLGRKPSARS